MADENVTQFGKDSFATYKEATVAAATYIMREVLADPKAAAQKFLSGRSDRDGQSISDIQRGGCPGEHVIAAFFGRTERLG